MSRILIAEDEEHIAKLMVFKLTREGHQCDWAKNGQELIDRFAIEGSQYDLLILDIMMPLMDGWTALEKIEVMLDGKELPGVIMVSARGPQQDLAIATRLSIKHYLRKPFDPAALARLVGQVLSE